MYLYMYGWMDGWMYVPFPSQINPTYTVAAHFFKIHFNGIFPSAPRFSKCSLSLRFPHQNSISTSSSPVTYHIKMFTHKNCIAFAVARERSG